MKKVGFSARKGSERFRTGILDLGRLPCPPFVARFRYNPPHRTARRLFVAWFCQISPHFIFEMPLAVPIVHLSGFVKIAAFVEKLKTELHCIVVVILRLSAATCRPRLRLQHRLQPSWWFSLSQ